MAGSDFVFNIAKGRLRTYAELGAASDALIMVPLEATGLEADETLKDYDDLAALLAGSSNEQTTMGRKTISSATITPSDTAGENWTSYDIADQTYTGATGNAVGKVLICYDGDTGAGTDSAIIPLTAHSFDVTPDGSDITVQINAAGFARSS